MAPLLGLSETGVFYIGDQGGDYADIFNIDNQFGCSHCFYLLLLVVDGFRDVLHAEYVSFGGRGLF